MKRRDCPIGWVLLLGRYDVVTRQGRRRRGPNGGGYPKGALQRRSSHEGASPAAGCVAHGSPHETVTLPVFVASGRSLRPCINTRTSPLTAAGSPLLSPFLLLTPTSLCNSSASMTSSAPRRTLPSIGVCWSYGALAWYELAPQMSRRVPPEWRTEKSGRTEG